MKKLLTFLVLMLAIVSMNAQPFANVKANPKRTQMFTQPSVQMMQMENAQVRTDQMPTTVSAIETNDVQKQTKQISPLKGKSRTTETRLGATTTDRFLQSVTSVPADAMGLLARSNTKNADLELTYLGGDLAIVIGNTLTNPSVHISGAINFTAGQMTSYVGGTLHTIAIPLPQASFMQGWSSAKVWIKGSLGGAIIHEQAFTPTLSDWNLVTLTTPHVITAGEFVIGFTVSFSNPGGASFNMRPLWGSDETDPYKPGGFNYIMAASATAHESGASWNQFTSAGNLGITGLVSGVSLSDNDLAATLLSANNTIQVAGSPYTYTVAVSNTGTASQNNYTVQLIDAANNVLASQAMTTALAAGASTNVNLTYTPTTAGDLTLRGKVVLTSDEVAENNITEPATFRVYPLPPMHYCTYADISGIGTNNPATLSAAIGFPTSAMDPFAERLLTTIEIGITAEPSMLSNCVLWIRNSLNGSNLYSQSFTPVEGWNTIQLTTPYLLQNENTFIGYTLTTTGGFPLGTTNNTQNAANGGHLGMEGDWFTLSDVPLSGNWAIIGTVIDDPNATCTPVSNLQASYNGSCNAVLTWTASDVPGATYNVYRGATQIATGIAATTYTDIANDEFQGYTWSVRAVCGSEESIARTVSLPYCTDPCGDFVITIGTTPWTEGFEGIEFPPQCWTVHTLEPDYYTWEHYVDDDPDLPRPGGSGIGYAIHWDTEMGEDQESWLITPAIQLPLDGICELSFWSTSIYADWVEHNGVWISETDNNPGSFSPLHTVTPSNFPDWEEETIPLQAYAGKTVYIAFKYTGAYANIWLIDDISIKKLADNDVELVAITQPNSGANLSNAEQVTVTLKNNGTENLTSVGLELFLDNTSQGTGTWTGNLATGATANYTFTPTLDLSAAATYEVKVVATMVGDENPANNTVVKNVTNVIVNVESIPYFHGFEGSPEPGFVTGWLATPAPAAQTYGVWNTNPDGGFTNVTPYEGSLLASIANDNTAATNGWLFTPAFYLVQGTTYRLEFYLFCAASQASLAYSPLTVRIGSGQASGSMDRTLLEIPANAGGIGAYSDWGTAGVTFTAERDGVHHIGFNSTSTTTPGVRILLDNVSIVEAVDNDLEILPGPYYTQVPVSQASSIKPSAQAMNVGAMPQTNVKLSGTIDGTAIGESAPIASIAPGTTSATMSFASTMTFAATGNREMVLTVAGDQTNQGTGNTATFNFTATENMFATDMLTGATGGGIGFAEPATFGVVYEITQTTYMSSIQLLFASSNTTTTEYTVALHPMTNATTMVATPVVTRTQNRVPGIVNVDFSAAPVLLTPGLYVVTLYAAENIRISYDSRAAGGWYNVNPTTNALIYNPGGQGFGSLGIRMIIDDDYEPGAIVALSTTPDNNATDVALNAVVKVTYNQLVTAADLSGVTISPNPGGVSASVSGNELIIAHSNFEENTVYTVTVPAGAIADYATATTWSFKTLTPKVSSTTPANNATQVAVNTVVRVTYDRPITDGTAPLTGVTISPDPGGVVATISGSQLNIAHNNFAENTLYTVTVPANTIKNYETDLSWSFATESPWEQPTNLTADVNGRDVTVKWNHQSGSYAEVVLTAGNVWGDGTGYQMLLDPTATAHGTTIPTEGPLTENCSGIPATLYDIFTYRIPENANPACNSSNIILNSSGSVEIPAGTYDYCITNPTPDDRIWVAGGNFGRGNNYVFEAGKRYIFTVARQGDNDFVTIAIEDIPGYTAPPPAKFNVYLDGVQKATEITENEFTFINLEGGSYIAGVEAVYTDGVSLRSNIEFSIVGDLGISKLVSPESGNLGNETVTVTVKNFGAIDVNAEIPVTYRVFNFTTNVLGDPVTQTFAINLAPDATQDVSFTTQANLSANGEYEIIAYPSFPGDGNHANDTLRETIANFSSIGELADGSNIGIYPNPVSEKLFISADEPIKRAEIYDISGRLVKVVQGDVKDIEVSDLRNGTYIVRFITDKGVVSLRFVKE
ncbi:MAG: DUF2436 domain-containing protein [Bacteroidales bacterium]|nr:DUF2436 domain-containing protein [Bacteroidales bacterium]